MNEVPPSDATEVESPASEGDAVASTILLVGATALALVVANSPWGAVVADGWHQHLGFGLDVHAVVNDGLMALFFLSVGIELKREFLTGALRDPRVAAVPAAAAIGGMIVPAVLYLAINTASGASHGWGIPMATDVAFALGVLAIAGRGAPAGVRLFLLTLAVVDDLGAIVVIAVFYSGPIAWPWLVFGLGAAVMLWWMQRQGVTTGWLALVAFGLAWICLFRSGVHATVAGVLAGFALSAEVGARWERRLDAPLRWVILPLFALANAGVEVSTGAWGSTEWRIVGGVALGLVIGKPAGIVAATWLTVRLGRASLPRGMAWRHVIAVGALGGMGFTVALLVADLAFVTDESAGSAARLAIVAASIAAAILAAGLLRSSRPVPPARLAPREGAR